MHLNGSVGACRCNYEQEEAEQYGPQGDPIGAAHRAVARAARRTTTVEFDHSRASSISDLTTDRHCASRRRLRSRSLTVALR
jgi:hypothetical protein